MLKYIPNALSLSRVPLSVVLFWALYNDRWELATLLFMIALATDAVDGWFARRFNVTSKLGGDILEPVCDLALSIAVIAGLYYADAFSIWVPVGLVVIAVLLQVSHATPFTWLKRHTFYIHPLFFCGVVLAAGANLLSNTYPGRADLFVIYMMTWVIIGASKHQRILEWLAGPPSPAKA